MSDAARYEPTRESLRTHPVPDWYHDAKLGIFIHWSVPSVPAFAPTDVDINELIRTRYDDLLPLSPYSEWYANSIKFPWSPAARHHRETYGDKDYHEFQADFEAALEGWDPAGWADLFARAGARYVVMVTKHHDGYCLWPSRVRNPNRAGWHAPRDCVGELAAAVRARGMRFGVYYSGGIDWSFNPTPVRNLGEFIASMPRGAYPAYAEAQMRELIERVRPDVLWNDISWPTDEATLFRLFVDYYAAVPEGVVNDRWLSEGWLVRALRIPPVRAVLGAMLKRALQKPGAALRPPAPPHFDARTPEYAVFPRIRREKWESVRGIDKSFGYNRCSREEDFLSRPDLLQGFADIVSKNGNLLLNVGPRGEDAVIPDVQARRLEWLGALLSSAGEAVYGTRPWQRAEGKTAEGPGVRFTARDDLVYALVLGTPAGTTLTLRDVPGSRVTALGRGPLDTRREGDDLCVELPQPLPDEPVHAFRIEP